MLLRTQLRDLVVAQLVAADTAASASVYPSRDWPIDTSKPSNFPAVLVGTPKERKESLGRQGAPFFTTTIDLAIVARILETGDNSDTAVASAEALCEQIEFALLSNPAITTVLQQFSYVETTVGVSADGRRHTVDVEMHFGCEVPQWYTPPLTTPLTEVDFNKVTWSPIPIPLELSTDSGGITITAENGSTLLQTDVQPGQTLALKIIGPTSS